MNEKKIINIFKRYFNKIDSIGIVKTINNNIEKVINDLTITENKFKNMLNNYCKVRFDNYSTTFMYMSNRTGKYDKALILSKDGIESDLNEDGSTGRGHYVNRLNKGGFVSWNNIDGYRDRYNSGLLASSYYQTADTDDGFEYGEHPYRIELSYEYDSSNYKDYIYKGIEITRLGITLYERKYLTEDDLDNGDATITSNNISFQALYDLLSAMSTMNVSDDENSKTYDERTKDPNDPYYVMSNKKLKRIINERKEQINNYNKDKI